MLRLIYVSVIAIAISLSEGRHMCGFPSFLNQSDVRPVIASTANNDCFFVFAEGHCTPSEWFQFTKVEKRSINTTQPSTCEQRPCPLSLENDKTKNFTSYWFEFQETCYFVIKEDAEFCTTKPFFVKHEDNRICEDIFPDGRIMLDNIPGLSLLTALRWDSFRRYKTSG